MMLIVSCAKEKETLPTPISTTTNGSIVGLWQHFYSIHYSNAGTPTYDTGFAWDYQYNGDGTYVELPNSVAGGSGIYTINGGNLILDYTDQGGNPVYWTGTFTVIGDTLRRFDNSYWSEKVYYRK